MRFYWPIAKLDHERHMVWGYASTEAEDDHGEIIRRDALEAALDDYMRFASIREMHQPSAVGIAEEAAIDDRGLYLGARIVDGEAWEKVVAGVYKGFSIGGRVTARDPADRNIITGLALTEISVVDRPANPEAVFDCWKRATIDPPADPAATPAIRTAGVSPACRPVDQRLGAGAPGRLRVLLAELCELLDSLSADDDEALAALAIADTLHKQLRSEAASLAAGLAKLADDIVPRLDALQRRVDDIAKTPLPPATAARGLTAIAKHADGHSTVATSDDIVAALAQMTDEERTLTLIKAAHANPVHPRVR
jgi:phage head maturation protease